MGKDLLILATTPKAQTLHRADRPGRRALLCLCLAGLVAATGCTIESPQLPSFTTEWLIPIGVETRTLRELIEDVEGLVEAGDGSLVFESSGELDSVAVGDRLDAEIEGLDFTAEIGEIALSDLDPVDVRFRLGQLYPAAEALDGFSVPVPAFDFAIVAPAQDLPGFRWAQIASGALRVQLDNGLPVPIGGGGRELQIRLIDPETDALIRASTHAAAIAAGGSAQLVIDLAGAVLPDSLRVELDGGSAGSGAAAVAIDSDAELAISVQPEQLLVVAAEAEVPQQQFDELSTVDLPDSVQIQSATIASGTLALALTSDLPVPVDVALRIDGLKTPGGADFLLAVALPPNASQVENVDLAAHRFDFGSSTASQLQLRIDALSPGSGAASVVVQSSDRILASVAPMTLRFSELAGVIAPQRVEIASSESTLEIPEELEGMQFGVAELILHVDSDVGVPAAVELTLTGYDEQDQPLAYALVAQIPAAQGGDAPHLIERDENDPGLLDFLNHLPTRIVVEGFATIGDGVTVGSVRSSDLVRARYEIRAPLVVSIAAKDIELDPDALDLDDDLREELRARLVSARLEATVRSTLPLAAAASIGLDPDPANVHLDPALSVGPILLPASPDGSLVSAQSIVELDAAAIELLTSEGMQLGALLRLPGTNGQLITVRAGDRLEISGYLRATIEVGED